MSKDMATHENCNTYNILGFHLQDLPKVRNRVLEAITHLASNPEDAGFARSLLPWWFTCSHCGLVHELSIADMHRALFEGPGAVDKMATLDHYKAILEHKLVSAAGLGQRNALARTAETALADFFNVEEPVEKEEEKSDEFDGKNVKPESTEQVQDSGSTVRASE